MRRWILAGLLLASGFASAGTADAPAGASQATQSLTAAGVRYTDVRRTLASQVVVHEFSDAGGKVFAVSWSGPFKPDLKELLGTHFDKYRELGARSERGDRSHLQVDTGEAIVVSTGRMGAFEGRAWLPASLPAGFDPQEMK
jgi:hypothetical protein